MGRAAALAALGAVLGALEGVHGSTPGLITFDALQGAPFSVNYTNRSFLINAQPTLLLAGCVHYPRSTPSQWPDIFAKMQRDGLNVVESYFFWNMHERKQGEWTFEFNGDLPLFIDLAAEAGLFVHLRIGPYVCAEWNSGGFPTWLNYLGGNLTTRSSEATWESLMGDVYMRVVSTLRDRFADKGGNIIMLQVENEYASWACDGSIGNCDMNYVDWCGDMSASANVPVPVVMCNGNSANNTIETCNGNQCNTWIESGGNSKRVLQTIPAAWTENEMWFGQWGMQDGGFKPTPSGGGDYPPPFRHPDELAASVLGFIARGGSYFSYYMLHGGTNWGRNAASSVQTAYADGAIFRSDGIPNEPLHSHTAALHHALAAAAPALLALPAQANRGTPLEVFNATTGSWQIVSNATQAFSYLLNAGNGGVVFVENGGTSPVLARLPADASVWGPLAGQQYALGNNSVIIVVGGTGAISFNSSAVPDAPAPRTYTPVPLSGWASWGPDLQQLSSASLQPLPPSASNASRVGGVVTFSQPLEQLNLTRDDTDYVWYTRSPITGATLQTVISKVLEPVMSASAVREVMAGTMPVPPSALAVLQSVGLSISGMTSAAFIVFVNGVYAADAYNNTHNYKNIKHHFVGTCGFNLTLDLTDALTWLDEADGSVYLRDLNGPEAALNITILSESIGIDNGHGAWVVGGVPFLAKGIVGDIVLGGTSIAAGGTWTMTVGLAGEVFSVYTAEGAAQVTWTPVGSTPAPAGTWTRAFFTLPGELYDQLIPHPGEPVMASLLLDIAVADNAPAVFGRGHVYVNGFDIGRAWGLAGYEDPTQAPSQRRYFIPADVLVPDVAGGNVVTFFDALPGSPAMTQTQIVFSQQPTSMAHA